MTLPQIHDAIFSMKNFNVNQFKLFFKLDTEELKFLKTYCVQFIKNPLLAIKSVPSFNWKTLIFFVWSLAFLSGLLSGIVSRSLFSVLEGTILFPFSSIISIFVGSIIWYYVCLFFLERTIPFKKIYSVFAFSATSSFLFDILFSYMFIFHFIGVAISSIFLIVGFVENFSLPKRFVFKFFVGLFALYTLIWIGTRVLLMH